MNVQLNIHETIINNLNYFIETNKIPNILFYGKSGSGKKTLVHLFLKRLYNDQISSNNVMFVNCAYGKGIKFIRNELKFFARTNLLQNELYHVHFKSIVLLNADKLTNDAQSALRRCIELYSHNSRFFMVAEDKYKLMKPILSRLCDINVSIQEPMNLHVFHIQQTYNFQSYNKPRNVWLKKEMDVLFSTQKEINLEWLKEKCDLYYEKGYTAEFIMQMIQKYNLIEQLHLPSQKVFDFLIEYNHAKKEIRNEKILMLFIFSKLFF
jgi:hypothetical protein